MSPALTFDTAASGRQLSNDGFVFKAEYSLKKIIYKQYYSCFFFIAFAFFLLFP